MTSTPPMDNCLGAISLQNNLSLQAVNLGDRNDADEDTPPFLFDLFARVTWVLLFLGVHMI